MQKFANKKKLFYVFIMILSIAFFMKEKVMQTKNGVVQIREHRFAVEIVSDSTKMQKGLGGRDNLCTDCGMLFQFPQSGHYSFWMKDMQFALDIIWINDGKIVHIEKNVLPTFLGVLSPLEEANQVLEINAGSVDKYNIKEGDQVLPQ